jgi:outer membrane protein assembly factor BamB
MVLDAVYEPIVLGRLMFIASPRQDTVTALDTRSGEEKWIFFADGPVRYSPVAAEGRVYFSSDDGFLYCLDAEKGSLLWKFRGGPADRRILGNERLISTWPARGAPVIADGTVYFAAGIWPFMGIFIHALDARTGKVVWTNEGDGSIYMQQPHNVDSFGGVAPQGPLTVIGEKLLVSGGRSVPACYDRKTGKLLYFKFAENGRRGGAEVAAAGGLFFAGPMAYDLSTGVYVGEFSNALALGSDLFCYAGKKKDLLLAKPPTSTLVETVDRKGQKAMKVQWKMSPSETIETPQPTCLVRAGNRLYAGSAGRVTAFELGKKPKEAWRIPIEGTPACMIAADRRLFVVTWEGRIYSFSGEGGSAANHAWRPARLLSKDPGGPLSLREGIAVLIGVADVPTLAHLAGRAELRTIALDSDHARVGNARRELAAAGLYGERVAVHEGGPSDPLPQYLASVIVWDASSYERETVRKLYDSVRPFGGKLFLQKSQMPREELDRWISGGDIPCAAVEDSGEQWAVVRVGAIPGSANWTNENADAANTRVSKDAVAKAPLGILWFGGPSHEGILPRHGHGPQPQVIDGRLLIEGVDKIRALDIYTGRLLWETSLPGVGDLYNNVAHQTGANATGANFVSGSDGIYVAWKKKCVRLSPETGKVISEFSPPGGSDWGYINVLGDLLIGGAEPLVELEVKRATEGGFDEPPPPQTPGSPSPATPPAAPSMSDALKKLMSFRGDNDTFSSSRRIFVMDRHTGNILWQASAQAGFRHNAICAGGGRLYAIDRLSGAQVERLKKKGETPQTKPSLVAYDLKEGREVWRSSDGVFGTWLSYSEARDVLIESGLISKDTLTDEAKNMRAWNASSGKILWHKGYSGPAMIHGDTVLAGDRACDLMTGQPRGRIHPITGQAVEWTWARNHGCNTPAASENLITFRSGAAGYFDLAGDGGTGNFGGFRSGCSNNLIVAGGLINAPDYTRTCICGYQNQASLALVPMPEAEMWTFFGTAEIKGPVKRLGVNLGAPGDRRAPDGTLWVEHPSVGGKSPQAPVAIDGKVEYFRKNSLHISGEGLPWVSASGIKGLSSLTLTLDKDARENRPHTVRLHFVEPDGLAPGDRVFDVTLQGEVVLKDFDVAREAGGSDRGVVREFREVSAGKEVKLKFISRKSVPVLCGIEVVFGSEPAPAPSVVHTDLTVPDSSATALKPQTPELPPIAQTAATPLRSALWVFAGALVFLLFGFLLFRRKPE